MELGPQRDQLRRGVVECEREHGLAPGLGPRRLLVDFHGSSLAHGYSCCDLRSELAQGGVSSPKRRVGFLALAVATAAGALLTGASAGSTGGASTLRTPAFFISSCGFSHRSWDDPIVYPRRPRLSHNHTFVGNVSTNAFSTLASLRRHGTTCVPSGDTAAYWAPTLLLNNQPVLPIGATVYYRRRTASLVKPLPPGLRMVAGSSRAWRAQSPSVTYWDCSVVKTTFYGPNAPRTISGVPPATTAVSSNVPSCPATTVLELHVNFPDCWEGKRLDSPDHRSHMAYSVARACPPSHPVAVPGISLVYRYKPPGPGVVILSSGGQHSGHADFINAWDQGALTKLVLTCLDARRSDATMEPPRPNTSQQYNQC
jgi:hypothetical protein